MPGSGKSTLGRRTAGLLCYTFIDLDQYISQQEKLSIPEIFRNRGESYFRNIEKMALHELVKLDRVIIATGGGTPTYSNNMEFMNEHGYTFYLRTAESELGHRLRRSTTERPLIQSKEPDDLAKFIHETLEQRAPFYEKAKFQIDTVLIDSYRLAELIKSL